MQILHACIALHKQTEPHLTVGIFDYGLRSRQTFRHLLQNVCKYSYYVNNAIPYRGETTESKNQLFSISIHILHPGWFVTKIFHPNIAPSTGEVCVSTLKKDWKPTYGISHILVTIKWYVVFLLLLNTLFILKQ